MCRETKLLLLVSALYTFAIGLSGVFVNLFIWKQNSDFKVIVIYNLIHYIATPIAFFIGGIIAKKKNGIWSLRIGLFIYSLFYALILLWGSLGLAFIYFLGVVYGMAIGFYWLAFNTLSFDFTSTKNRDTFNGFNGSCAGIATAIAPISSAFIISRFSGMTGYYYVFALTLILFIILFLISLLLRCKRCASNLDIKLALKGGDDSWKIIRNATVLWGFRDVIIIFILNILIIEATKSELYIGKLMLLGALTSSAAYMLVQKIIKPPTRRPAILIGVLGSFAAVLFIVVRVDLLSLAAYTFVDAFFLPFFMIQLSSAAFNVIDKAHEEDYRIEYMINKDIAINLGRVTSSIMLLVLLSFVDSKSIKDLWILRAYLVFIGLAPVAAGLLLRRLREIFDGKRLERG